MPIYRRALRRVNLTEGDGCLVHSETERPDPVEPAAPTSACISYNLRKASRIVSKIYIREMRPAPVRGPQFSLMMMIARRQSATISELAREIGADRTTMTRNLEKLQQRGFIQITHGKNLRTKAVEIAPKGRKALERSISYWQQAQSKVLKTLGQERWDRMLADLSALSALAERG